MIVCTSNPPGNNALLIVAVVFLVCVLSLHSECSQNYIFVYVFLLFLFYQLKLSKEKARKIMFYCVNNLQMRSFVKSTTPENMYIIFVLSATLTRQKI